MTTLRQCQQTILVWMLSTCCGIATAEVSVATDLARKQQELSVVTGSIHALQQTISADQSRQQDLQQQLRHDEIKIGQINQQIHMLNLQIELVETELQKIHATQQIYVEQLRKKQLSLGEQIRTIYQLGQTPTLKELLNPQDINTTNRHVAYYHALNQAHLALMADVKKTVAALNKSMSLIVKREKALHQILMQKQQQQRELASARLTREQTITALNQQTQTKQQELDTLTANQKALQAMLTTLPTPATPPIVNTPIAPGYAVSLKQLRGKLGWPSSGAISLAFGKRDTNNQHSTGVVIDAPEGTPVRSIYSGQVIFANWLRGFGLLVIINHGDGYMSLYARNQALFASVGDTVRAGDVIANVGNTGGFTKSSLYFEIRHNGTPINPRRWCS